MQKQAPSVARILIAVGFALSCFGLLLFLWVTFGGPTPFKAKSYDFKADFPEAVTLGKESDVRIGGVSVGKVKALSLPPKGNYTEATIELDPQFAPIPDNTRAILRQKTLLGETYIELTGGTKNAPTLSDGGQLKLAQTQNSTQIDEIFQALDKPTRQAFRIWQQNAAIAIHNRGLDLNDAFGNLGPFATDATQVVRILNQQSQALKGLVRNTGTVFDALTANDNQLAGAISNSNTTFRAIASRNSELAQAIQIFPTFNNETRLTLNRLASFAVNTRPLVRDLQPVARNLTPTLQAVQQLSPHLKRLFTDLGPLITASQKGLPALRKILSNLKPVLAALDPFLANLNPIVRYVNYYKTNVSDFLSNPEAGISSATPLTNGNGAPPARTLRVLTYISPESLSIYPTRDAQNRGNGYLQPLSLNSYAAASGGIFPNFDCKPSGGPVPASAAADFPQPNIPCFVAPKFPNRFGGGQAPQAFADP
jgi:virulence factor Mce-like protein